MRKTADLLHKQDALDTLFLLDSVDLEHRFEDLLDEARDTAKRYALRSLHFYSLAHPTRLCSLRCGMGSLALHVESRLPGRGPYVFDEGPEEFQTREVYRFGVPDFILRIWQLGEKLGQPNSDWVGDFKRDLINGVSP